MTYYTDEQASDAQEKKNGDVGECRAGKRKEASSKIFSWCTASSRQYRREKKSPTCSEPLLPSPMSKYQSATTFSYKAIDAVAHTPPESNWRFTTNQKGERNRVRKKRNCPPQQVIARFVVIGSAGPASHRATPRPWIWKVFIPHLSSSTYTPRKSTRVFATCSRNAVY